MPSTPQIIWCAQSSWHYIVEGPVRYQMPLYLAIQAKEYLKRFCTNKDYGNCVARWVSSLGPADRINIRIIDQQTHIAI